MSDSGRRLGMEKVREILRLNEQGMSKTAIGRSCNVTRQTVRDYIRRANAADITYAQVITLPEERLQELFGKKRAGRRVKDRTLDFKHISMELCKKGVTLQVLWEEYLRSYPEGYSYSQFCTRYREWRKDSALSMRQNHKAGEKAFVDYCGQTVEIIDRDTGEVTLAQVFVGALGASNYIFCEATASQQLVHWLGSHARMFEFFGGVPQIVVPDNLKSGVKSPCRYEPEINRSYHDLAEHYGVAILPTRVRKPKDKAKVENAVQQVERRILARLRNRTFHTVAELNSAIAPLLDELNNRTMKGYDASRRELFEQLDMPVLAALPQIPYEFGTWKQAKVSIDYHIEIERHFYSVPYQLRGRTVWVRYTERMVEIFNKNTRVALHRRCALKGRHTTIAAHMPAQHRAVGEWTPERLLNWAHSIGDDTAAQVHSILTSRRHPEQAYRSCLGLLALSKKFGNERLNTACRKANRLGIISMRSIKNMLTTGLERLQDEELSPSQPTTMSYHSNVRGDTAFH